MSARSELLSQDRELLPSTRFLPLKKKINEILLNFAYNRMVNMQQSMTLVLLRPYTGWARKKYIEIIVSCV